jgi:hypothetical protein
LIEQRDDGTRVFNVRIVPRTGNVARGAVPAQLFQGHQWIACATGEQDTRGGAHHKRSERSAGDGKGARILREAPTLLGAQHAALEHCLIRGDVRPKNSLDVGLGGSVWGNDPSEAARYASRLECGTAWVNQHGALHPLAPFGGVKHSGIGVEFNVDGLKEYTTVQVVNVAL